jgi:hypothetical protein
MAKTLLKSQKTFSFYRLKSNCKALNIIAKVKPATRASGQFPSTSYARFLFFYALAAPKLPNSRWRAQTASILWAPLAKKNNELSRDVTENSPAFLE